jgi:hypothetical protein
MKSTIALTILAATLQFSVTSAHAQVTLWQDNPQDLRSSKDYSSISDNQYYACWDANDLEGSPSFNNETAYYDCLDVHLANGPLSGDQGAQTEIAIGESGPPPASSTSTANGCDKRGNVVSTSSDRDALISISNTGTKTLYVHWIDSEGLEVEPNDLAFPKNIIEANGVVEFTSKRGNLFAVLDESGSCAGVAEPRESSNSYSFGLE